MIVIRTDRAVLLGALVAGTLLLGCRRQEPDRDLIQRPPAPAAAPVADLARQISSDWVALYDPRRAFNGYTLALFRGKTPILIDMNGRLAHAWPEVEARSRVRLLPDGSLLTIALGGSKVQQFDWDGGLTWDYATGGRLPHHDLIRLENGNTLIVVLEAETKTDDLIEVDAGGNVVWDWDAGEGLRDDLGRARKRAANRTHINSVQELPPNRWFEAGDRRFRPGNLLISARNLNALYIIERPTGKVVWSLKEGLEQQHEALMNGPRLESPGLVQVFDNRPFSGRRSAILELDPRDGRKNWKYAARGFFSATKGAQQALPNGNLMITSSRGWRAFEVTRGGEVVWQWTPPFELQRPQRYAYDHCPQLVRLSRPAEGPVRPAAGYRYIDRQLYALTRRNEWVGRRFGGDKKSVLRRPNRCRILLLPQAPQLQLGFGLATERIAATGRESGAESFAARFSARLRPLDSDTWIELFAETVAYPDESWRQREVPLHEYAFQRVNLCITIEEAGENDAARARGLASWNRAEILPKGATESDVAEAWSEELTPEQLAERRRHLEALGYID